MMCNGQYVEDHPCYPLCPSPSGWGCDYSSVFGGSSSGGPTGTYSVTTGDPLTGNTQTTTHTNMIDPYQSIIPSELSFDGSNRETRTAMDGSGSGLWFNQTGINVGGKDYQYWPIFTFDPGNGDFPDSDNLDGFGNNNNPRLRVSAIRTVNGVWG